MPSRRAYSLPTVHPRVRGERDRSRDDPPDCRGSSPRARGTRRDLRKVDARHRFIPACAGNALEVLAPEFRATVHPRVRGERNAATSLASIGAGSSPRARGTLPFPAGDQHHGRFIPACAGNACSPSSNTAVATVHPRVRGERWGVRMIELHIDGSSPRARGTRS